MKYRILIADDHPGDSRELRIALEAEDFKVTVEADGAVALEEILDGKFDALICELVLPSIGGPEIIHRILSEFPGFPVFVWTRFGSIDKAFEFAQLGAASFSVKTDNSLESFVDDISNILSGESKTTEETDQEESKLPFTQYISRNVEVESIFKTAVEKIAKAPTTVLITGESGSGKELLAKTIHHYSPRKDNPWVAVHCAALPENLIESELFGHEKGSFTSASSQRLGRFEQANTGTFFLDEVGDLSPVVQTKLLRVLQERTIERVGSNKPVKVDVRIIAATNRDLSEMVKSGDFRQDLFYRISVINLELPPLRERPEDIPGLANFFVNRFRKKVGRDEMVIPPRTMSILRDYSWPGNVRELENVIERAVVLAEKNIIELEDLPDEIIQSDKTDIDTSSLREAKAEFEKEFIIKALRLSFGNVSATADTLDIARKNLQEKIKKYEIDVDSMRKEK